MSHKTYKHSFISKEILKYLLLAGTTCIGASSPQFVLKMSKNILSNHRKPYKKKQVENAFDYLRRKGFLEIDREEFRVRIALTEKGKKKAGRYQINDLKILKPEKWDKKWRIIIFDVPHALTIKRNAFREKLRELGFYLLQKSVWVHPYDCRKEVRLLSEFFGLDEKSIRIIIAENLGQDREIKSFFRI